MYYDIECPQCKNSIYLEVDVPNRLVYWEEACEECKYKFSSEESLKIYDNALTDCYSTLIDYAHDFSKERNCTR